MRNDFYRNRISWTWVFSGLIVGVLVFLVTLNLGVFIMTLFGFDLYNSSIAAIIWSILSLIASSYVAWMTAMTVLTPDEKYLKVEEDAEEIEASVHRFRKQTKVTGLITGSLIVLVTTYLAATGLGSILSGATKILGGTTAAVVTGTAGAGVGLNNIDEVRNYVSNIDRDEIETLIAQNIKELNKEQITATSYAVERVLKDGMKNIQNSSLTNIVPAIETNYKIAKEKLSGNDFIARLEARGLTNAQAKEVSNVINKYIEETEKNVTEAVKTAIETITITARTASISWIIYALTIIGFTILGAMSMKHTKDVVASEEKNKKVKNRV